MTPEPAAPRRRSAARDRFEHVAFRLGDGLLAALPDRAAARVGGWLVRVYARVGRSRRRILHANLRAAFPEKSEAEIGRLARASADWLGTAFVEFLQVSGLDAEGIRDRVRVVGEEHLAAARARGRGVFLLSAHFGGWELGAIRAGLIGEPIAPVVRPLDNPLLEEELERRRTRFGNRLIAKHDAARDVLRTLRDNGTVAILVDQNVLPNEGVFVPFFGRLAATTPALALFHLKTDAAVVPAFVWPEGSGRYRLELGAPILADEFRSAGADRDEAVRRATARYMEVTEAVVRGKPEAWLWMHDRWKTRPA
ncbi:MAG TPA: lysophospholipid acyltransferase family protein [Thermoanaerobaculia bacterium]|nr:lysophospholipid acyltransferase family protein [Thermoanaerobaculia bacterium]